MDLGFLAFLNFFSSQSDVFVSVVIYFPTLFTKLTHIFNLIAPVLCFSKLSLWRADRCVSVGVSMSCRKCRKKRSYIINSLLSLDCHSLDLLYFFFCCHSYFYSYFTHFISGYVHPRCALCWEIFGPVQQHFKTFSINYVWTRFKASLA